MDASLSQWLQTLLQVAPFVLMSIPQAASLAPVASTLIHAIGEVQATTKTGADKRAHVLSVVADAVTVANKVSTDAGKPALLDQAQMQVTAGAAIDAVVETVKVIQTAHQRLASTGPGGVTSAVA